MKREERHQAKRNDLQTLLEEAAHYASVNLKQAVIAGVAILVLLLGAVGVRTWLGNRSATASRMLGELISTYNAPITATIEDLQEARPGVPTFTSIEERDRKVLDLADAILKSGGSTTAQAGALLYRGIAQAEMKQEDAAAASFGEVVERDRGGLFGAMGQLRLARLKEAQGKTDDAIVLYQAIADAKGGILPPEEGLLGLARCKEQQGKKDEAIALYRRVISSYPDSEYAGEARAHVADET